MRAVAATTFLVAAIVASLLVSPVYQQQQRYQQETISHLGLLPSPIVHALILEFDGVTSDYLLLKTISFIGYKLLEKQHLTGEEWESVVAMLQLITDLDPRFWDPYLLGEMMLPWDANRLDAADALLEKAARNRPDDFHPLYFLGFNAFYFEKNAEKAAPYLRQAARKNGAPFYLKGLAARFSLYGNETQAGIVFLQQLLKTTSDQTIRTYLKKRLTVLEDIVILEKKINSYEDTYHHKPAALDDLVKAGLLDTIPEDPYGGKYFILPNGRVYTTSKMVTKAVKDKQDKN